MTNFRLKRIYDDPEDSDGYRVLVDRLWPRGVSKARAKLDEWCRDVAPSTELRTSFGHDPSKFAGFSRAYRAELRESGAADELRDRLAREATVTLLIAARDVAHDHGTVLLDVLDSDD